ncbi:hypothetical protein EV183_000319 [Coemansia sp. RSA 2336]|nr:hypothetical protein EV183_000319 [Coemansia sp. RSA 2336]
MSITSGDDTQATVLYYCPCSGCMRTRDGAASIDEQQNTESPAAEPAAPVDMETQPQLAVLRTWPIEKLYYCDDCSQVRCQRCVIEEPAGYHCPNCLFDVPTASVRSEKNCCARNCFECPVCTHVLAVVEVESLRGDGGQTCFVLSCAVCLWDSREIGWEFEKSTGISAQIERMRAAQPAAKEYASLLDYWRSVQRASATANSASHSFSTTGSFKHRLTSAGLQNTTSSNPPPYTAASYRRSTDKPPLSAMAISDANYVSPAGNLRNSEPQRIRLHMKLSRRCRICHHILIKPESKAQATRFKIQLMAANFLPTVTLPRALPRGRGRMLGPLNADPLRVGVAVPVVLRFTNPLYTEVEVSLVAGRMRDAQVEVLEPQFTLPPFADLWELDDDDYDVMSTPGTPSSETARRGIVHRQGNRIAVQIQVTPQASTSCLSIPLLVKCSHMDEMADIDTPEASASRRVVSNAIWVYVSLGAVN